MVYVVMQEGEGKGAVPNSSSRAYTSSDPLPRSMANRMALSYLGAL